MLRLTVPRSYKGRVHAILDASQHRVGFLNCSLTILKILFIPTFGLRIEDITAILILLALILIVLILLLVLPHLLIRFIQFLPQLNHFSFDMIVLLL